MPFFVRKSEVCSQEQLDSIAQDAYDLGHEDGYEMGWHEAVEDALADVQARSNAAFKTGRNTGFDEGIQKCADIITRITLELSGSEPDDGAGS